MILLLLETNHRYQWINETNFFKTKQNFLIGGKLLFNVILVSAIQQNESVIIIYTLLLKSPYCPPISPLQVITEPSWAPCVIQQLPTNSFIHDSVQMSMLLSHFVPPPFLHQLCPQVCSLLGSSVPFFQIPYIFLNIQYLFFSF